MTQPPPPQPPTETPQEGIADAFAQLSERTAALVRQEIDAAVRETRERLVTVAVPAALLGGAAVAGLAAAASAHRLLLRLLEKAFGPAGAALVALLLYGAGGAGLAAAGVAGLRTAEAPYPRHALRHAAGTARATGEAAAQAAADRLG